ncbi:MAG: tRNA lysidine(34) synthetase TilS [Sphingobacteriia bacterium 24-36-13]|jgi:tRNA(Ile)-lysidine synthase|uniref:tRNA lysidine(34) synthetase TilS n=1 Tax=Sediminibacterium sp. TaxID=1917865 RepID=UPI000BC90996|nr:tRNA lysidine(34) synthetase TilS [Sediminibacterium sp.]OYY11321.1 MAG: tRNA lysidine(34) synthetase TilS [Sphingobacteriia bacterium 35-36-14]OYZ55645.1 MAG: tRNA lysidine(34) synthetase TilS [Sphingobacteriia bacterium 24-36-13]OZA64713.1 MAG: tRNA lysidine(34) synthetase TilS [Sphingobacteriia bacterium 39-36-14]HQS23282.1 tRNA lysidine(34) synthetase TilS [Sediminibacterium sp.]HQS36052.1 tRNA lysidine(34) synthetase TilS [Sediminibacterium sp.]
MNLLNQFQQNWQFHYAPLILPRQKILLALSGGIDSTVLAHLLHQSKIEFIAAHVNYQLRGEESNRDENFIVSLCTSLQIPLLVKRIDTKKYMSEKQLSVQVAAREIRYNWFDEIRLNDITLSNAWVATAHHANDSVETSMMHFFRGTGIEGLKGISAIHQSKKILRPLLPFFRSQIELYAEDNGISFIVDSSNLTNQYTRNFLRNSIIPELEKVIPSVQENIFQNTQRFSEVTILYKQAVHQQLKKMLEQKGNEWHIPVLKWKKVNPIQTITWEIIEPFGFSAAQISEVIKLLDGTNSSFINSPSHRIIKNRQWMIIAPTAQNESNHIVIEGIGKTLFIEGELTISSHDIADVSNELTKINLDTKQLSIEWLDAHAIKFPLLLRQWAVGDYFYPLGMSKKKKVAKFLIDSRLSKTDKEKIWVLESNKKIIAIIGLRIDNRFRYTAATKQLLKIQYTRI